MVGKLFSLQIPQEGTRLNYGRCIYYIYSFTPV
jgi:hypothetical protein